MDDCFKPSCFQLRFICWWKKLISITLCPEKKMDDTFIENFSMLYYLTRIGFLISTRNIDEKTVDKIQLISASRFGRK